MALGDRGSGWAGARAAIVRTLALVVVVLAFDSDAGAQCTGQWLPGAGVPGISGVVRASVMWDPDGPGPLPPVLVVAGSFTVADGSQVSNIAYWNGSSWSGLGSGLGVASSTSSAVNALAIASDGSLVAGGSFTNSGSATLGHIAKWNGTSWVPFSTGTTIDMNNNVDALAVLPNGSLVAGGDFTTSGNNSTVAPLTITVNHIAVWNGTAWSAINPAGAVPGVSGSVDALAVDGSGNLIAGGAFTTVGNSSTGSTTVNRIALWNGTNWSLLGSGLSNTVYALALLPNGNIAAGGAFTSSVSIAGQPTTPAANYVAVWNGTAWSALSSGVDSTVLALAAMPNGDLIVGGSFIEANGTYTNTGSVFAGGLARWNGAWSSMWVGPDARTVFSLLARSDGSLVVGGTFKAVSEMPANGVALLDGTTWQAITSGETASSAPVTALANLSGNAVLAGGGFRVLEGVAATRVASQAGATWQPFGTGLSDISMPSPVIVRAPFQITGFATLPNGDVITVGDDFGATSAGPPTVVAQWNGSAWSGFSPNLGPSNAYAGIVGDVYIGYGEGESVAVMPNGNIVVGGAFFFDGAPTTFHYLAMWNGSQWIDMGITNGGVLAMVVRPNGHLVIGGVFTLAGGVSNTNHIADWDGVSTFGDGTPEWTALGIGMNNNVNALLNMPDGSLVAAGEFTAVGNVTAGDTAAVRVARWNATSWTALGSGLSSSVYALALMPNNDLVAGGAFTAAIGTTPAANRVARWNGSSWSAMGTGLSGTGANPGVNYPGGAVFSLAVDSRGVLLVGGDIGTAGGNVSAYLARWADCVGACCQSDGSCTIAAGSPTASCTSGTLVIGGTCTPNTCPAAGVCCRGATCSTSITQANCTAVGTVGASFLSSASACNGAGADTAPCCYADFNHSGSITVQDIFDFLSAWFGESPYAKVGGDGVAPPTVQAIFDFLAAWFARGC